MMEMNAFLSTLSLHAIWHAHSSWRDDLFRRDSPMHNLSLCTVRSALLDDNCVAVEGYYRATTALMKVAGIHRPEAYAAAKQECVAALNECKRTKLAMTRHCLDHGC